MESNATQRWFETVEAQLEEVREALSEFRASTDDGGLTRNVPAEATLEEVHHLLARVQEALS